MVILGAVGGSLPGVRIETRGLRIDFPVAREPARRQDDLGARRGAQVADAAAGRVAEPHRAAAGIGAQRRDFRRRGVDALDLGAVPVHCRAPAHQAIAAVVAGQIGHQVGATGAGVDGVGKVLHPLGAGQPSRAQRRCEGGAEHVTGAHDAVFYLDLVAVERDVDIVGRFEHQPQAEVHRLFRIEVARAEAAGQVGVVAQQLGQARRHLARYRVDVGAVVGLRVADLRERRRAEAGTGGAAYRHHRRKIVARIELAAGGIAGAVVVVLRAHRRTHEPLLHRVEADVVVDRQHRAFYARSVIG